MSDETKKVDDGGPAFPMYDDGKDAPFLLLLAIVSALFILASYQFNSDVRTAHETKVTTKEKR